MKRVISKQHNSKMELSVTNLQFCRTRLGEFMKNNSMRTTCSLACRQVKLGSFTLIELLVVIAIIQSFVHDRYRFSGHGRRKIILALIAKHIPRDIIDTALEEIDDEIYFDNLCHFINRKASSLNMSLFEDRNKVYRYAIGRGFESSLIVRALKLYISNNQE